MTAMRDHSGVLISCDCAGCNKTYEVLGEVWTAEARVSALVEGGWHTGVFKSVTKVVDYCPQHKVTELNGRT